MFHREMYVAIYGEEFNLYDIVMRLTGSSEGEDILADDDDNNNGHIDMRAVQGLTHRAMEVVSRN